MSSVVRLEYAYGVCPKCKCGNYLRYLIRKDGLIHKPYEIKCLNCNSYFTKEDIFGNGEETTPKPITNADRIRAMTDDELAAFMFKANGCSMWVSDYSCKEDKGCHGAKGACWLDWLKQECEK